MELKDSIEGIKGIGPRIKSYFEKASIKTVEDLLFFAPISYEDRTHLFLLINGSKTEKRTFRVKILSKEPIKKKKGLLIQRFLVEDASAQAEITFFNQAFLNKAYNPGDVVNIYGKIAYFKGKIYLSSPQIEKAQKYFSGKIQGHYGHVEGISDNTMKKYMANVFEDLQLRDFVPQYLINRYDLLDRKDALYNLHFPKSPENLQKAFNTLIFEEFFLFQLSLLSLKTKEIDQGIPIRKTQLVKTIIKELPFSLTEGQEDAWNDIHRDMSSGKVMQRLLQGDVGSGKTVVAMLATASVLESGYQTILMAPTEILANQHMKSFLDTFSHHGVRIELLTGSTSPKRRKDILWKAEMGLCDILIGTHALIEDGVNMPFLGLTIIDEQHRFGVEQRKKIQSKRKKAHILVMSATPIPRSLGLVLFGDMDISNILSLPSTRKAVKTLIIGQDSLTKAYSFIREELEKKSQVYVVCPLIDENQKLELESAMKIFQNLKDSIFPDYKVALLHGKMKAEEKSSIMEDFSNNKIQVLVSTTVIEVGVNVPNATILLIFNAERFGLATLHQLRGRIGRGNKEGYCILYSESDSPKTWERLKIIESSTDGFYISQKDLELRGSGEFFGIKQSGLHTFKIGNPIEHMDIMRYAQIEARTIIKENHLREEELPLLLMEVNRYKDNLGI